MIYFVWNCRGIGQTSTVDALQEQIHKNKPSKTKVKGNGIDNICRSLGYQRGFFVGAIGQSGGLSLWWKDPLTIQILSASINAIDTCVLDSSTGTKVRISWFYAPPHAENKCAFWDNYTISFSADGLPWMCIGDFNELLWPYEKKWWTGLGS